jgi:hypothetical protein
MPRKAYLTRIGVGKMLRKAYLTVLFKRSDIDRNQLELLKNVPDLISDPKNRS